MNQASADATTYTVKMVALRHGGRKPPSGRPARMKAPQPSAG